MKTLEEIYGEMVGRFRQETGLELRGDGDMAVRLYTVAAQIYALSVQTDWVKRQCFPQTAQGEALDQHAQLRGLERRQAAAARGTIRFELDEPAAADLTIPAGTVCMTAGLVRFATEVEAVLPAGQRSTEVPARAEQEGSGGNAAAGSVRTMAVPPAGVSRCTNPGPFTGGTDRESDEDLRRRVLDTFRRMPNGANAAFYEQGALSFPEVAAAAVLPRVRGRGTVDVVAATAAGLPDSGLLKRLQEYFSQRREIAVDVLVRAPEIVSVDLSVRVSVLPGKDPAAVQEAVRQALTGWFTGARLGSKVLRAQLGAVIYAVDGVENYRIDLPAEDLAMERAQLPVLGTLTVGALEAGV